MSVIGIVGLGKLGLPVAVCMAQRHHVLGYDVNPALMKKRKYEWQEQGICNGEEFQSYLDNADLEFVTLERLAQESEIIFVAVQTPHKSEFEGVTRLPVERADFDYSYLKEAVRQIVPFVRSLQTLVIISTVLPGTIRKHILPIVNGKCKVAYNPFFPAMGTVMHDFFNPEFVLIGTIEKNVDLELYAFYRGFFLDVPILTMSIESAELVKCAYNLFIGMKIVFANTMLEIADFIPDCDVDDVTRALGKANKRLLSSQYLRGGLGDGGACHIRDGVAMSWLSAELGISHNLFGDVLQAREDQTEWLVDLIDYHRHREGAESLPVIILGKAFKPETNITTGSCALLLMESLKERGIRFAAFDPYVEDNVKDIVNKRALIFIATKHQVFAHFRFTVGSVVLDPHRYIKPQDGVQVIPIGAGR